MRGYSTGTKGSHFCTVLCPLSALEHRDIQTFLNSQNVASAQRAASMTRLKHIAGQMNQHKIQYGVQCGRSHLCDVKNWEKNGSACGFVCDTIK